MTWTITSTMAKELHLLGLIISSYLFRYATSATLVPPTAARWHTPCAGQQIHDSQSLQNAVTSLTQSMSTMDDASHYRNIHYSALVTKEQVSKLKLIYENERIRDTETLDFLKTLQLRDMVHIIDVDPITMDTNGPTNRSKVALLMNNMYKEMATVAMIVKQARLDQLTYERELGTDYVDHYTKIENTGVYPCLCHLRLAIAAHNSQLTFDDSRISLRHTNVSPRSARDKRDFVMLNVLDEILDRRSRQFSLLHQRVSNL